LKTALTGVVHVIVVPDDVLHSVPLDALPTGEVWRPRVGTDTLPPNLSQREAIGNRVSIEVRSSLFERLSAAAPPAGKGSLLALGHAAFDSPPAAELESSPAALAKDSEEPAALASSPERSGQNAGRLRGSAWERGFPTLPETRAEVRAIGDYFEEVFGKDAGKVLLERRKASRENLFELAPKARFLHVATHGWFAPESVRSFEDPEPIDKQTGLGRRMSREERVRGMSPMLLCGLALAGANLPADATGRIPGLVTAEELSTLDLSNCELAVLSACDTNVGVRRAGQGVASLQRALHMAGARSVITSLWRVPDEATKDLMVDFYRRIWVEKKPKAQALWEAKMKLRGAKDEAGRPRYTTRDWAAWVLTGDPR
jgi:CHAT domain-containing protein